jgi:CheY-like chemotaxis protein
MSSEYSRRVVPDLRSRGSRPTSGVMSAADDDARRPDIPTHRRRVLIVDDDLDFLAIAEASLGALGFEVARASGGLRGVFLATQEVPDAVVCDLRMPGIDGFVVAEALRSDPATMNTTIIACTGRVDLRVRATAGGSAFDAVLAKPVDWESVAGFLRTTIDARRELGHGGSEAES